MRLLCSRSACFTTISAAFSFSGCSTVFIHCLRPSMSIVAIHEHDSYRKQETMMDMVPRLVFHSSCKQQGMQ